ncbi:MAG: VIT domain-containing protein [Candidatus Kariarchaeaceae archaeon]|jgi:Mg-chelatase subunit ChlD
MKKQYQVLLLMFIILPLYIEPSSAQSGLLPSSLSIEGVIADNFANISYGLVFDNQDSSEDTQVEYKLAKPEGLYLSNVSAIMGDLVYWGEVNPIKQAQEKYNESIAANKSAVLVSAIADYYLIELNVVAGKSLYLTIYFEGYLTRKLGIYSLDLFRPISTAINLDFSLNIDVISSLSTVQRLLTPGLLGVSAKSISGGKQISFSQSGYSLGEELKLQYTLSQLQFGGKLLTYDNGTDQFFLYLLAPEIQNVADREPREFIFVIDVSGSMGGGRLDQAKEAFTNMIETLDDDDLFNVISFESVSEKMWVEPKVANLANINEAVTWVNNLQASGSTNFNAGVVSALESFVGDKTVKAVTVLSDGVPTVGEGASDSERQMGYPIIRNNVKNANVNEALIYSIAFGSSTAESLMASIAYDSGGTFVKIEPGETSVQKLGVFYQEFATPVALGYSVSYVNGLDILPSPIALQGAMFNGSEVLQTGRYKDQLTISTTIKFSDGDQVYSNLADTAGSSSPHIERIWAINTINQLVKIVQNEGETEVLKDRIVSIAVQYGIVVPGYTALIIVIDEPEEPETTEPNEFKDVTSYYPTAVDYQNDAGDSYTATTQEGAAIREDRGEKTAESGLPGLLWISSIVALSVFSLIMKRKKLS